MNTIRYMEEMHLINQKKRTCNMSDMYWKKQRPNRTIIMMRAVNQETVLIKIQIQLKRKRSILILIMPESFTRRITMKKL